MVSLLMVPYHCRTPTQRLDTNKRGALGGTLAQVYAASQSKHGWLLYNGSASCPGGGYSFDIF